MSSTKATEEEDFDDTRSFASSMIQSPKSLDRRLRGSLDIKPILDLSEIGETDLHEEPTPIHERPEPLLEEPELENLDDDHKDTPIPSVKATPVTSRTGSAAPTSRSVAPSVKSSIQGSPAGSRSASPAPSLTGSLKSIKVSIKGSSTLSRATSPTPSIARSLAPSETAEEDHHVVSDDAKDDEVFPKCSEPLVIGEDGAGEDGNEAAASKEAEPTDVDIADKPQATQEDSEDTEEVKEAVEANLDHSERLWSAAEHESSEDQAPSAEILPESSMNDLEPPVETAEESTVPDELQKAKDTSSTAAEPTESELIQNEPETEDTDKLKSEDLVAEEPVIEDSLANEAQDINTAITVNADVDNSGTPVIPEELEDNIVDSATRDDCEEMKREEPDPVDTEVLLEDTIGVTPPGSFPDEVKDATIDSENLDEPDEEVEMTTNDQPGSQTQDTLANDEVKDTDVVGDIPETSTDDTDSAMPGGDTIKDETVNIDTVEAKDKMEEASVDDPLRDEAVEQAGDEEIAEELPAETVLSDEPLVDDQSKPIAEDAIPEASSEQPKCVAEQDEKTLDLEPGETAEEDEKKHRKNLIAAAAAGVAAAVTAHEAKKHRRKKEGHWEREPASPISTTKDGKHVLDRHKDDAKLFSSAFARQLDKAKEDRDRYHQSDEYKEKQRRRRERREKREAAEAEERRKERAFLRKQQELREVYDASMNKKTSELQRDAEDRRRKEFEKRQRDEEDRRMHRTTSHRPRASSSRRSSAGSDGTRPAIMKRIATGESDTGGPLLKINMAKAGGYNIPRSAPVSPPRSTKASAVDRANEYDSASGTDGGHRRHRHRRRHHSRHGTAEELFETTSRVNVDGKTVLSEKLVRRTTNNTAEFDEPPGRKLWRKVVNAIHQ